MDPTLLAQNGLSAVVLFSLAALLFGWAAWHLMARFGAAALAGVWIVSALSVTTLMSIRIRHVQTALGFSAAQQAQFPVFAWFLPMWAIGLGAVALLVRRRAKVGGQQHFTRGLAARSVGVFWLGFFVFFFVFALLDVAAVFR